MRAEAFPHDVFLSHSAKDKAVVRPLGARARTRFSQQSTLNPQLDGDPLNQERRFIPLRLGDAPIKVSLAQFLYIKWRPEDREHWRN